MVIYISLASIQFDDAEAHVLYLTVFWVASISTDLDSSEMRIEWPTLNIWFNYHLIQTFLIQKFLGQN